MAEKWIQKAHLKSGALTAKAKSAGMSLSKFMAKTSKPGSKASETTKRQVALAKTLKKLGK